MKQKNEIEQMLAELDETVRMLSANETTLEQALELYAEAANKIAQLSGRLQDAEIRIAEIGRSLTPEGNTAHD